ncbi:hypothetical protein N0V93_000302 [Gnomoniopsis smithogilvyi]|uniref:SET domain-containing protein n=1 Tax=Gnomoniopsis smithogilvyi TaxID=1191159 RepID=A0A9W8Z209_9PEZI|nr:hypothetical protein N0V93_000302 [Gnomoniopsis smithogilvyi]
MTRERLSLQALPAWMGFNNATLANIEIQQIQQKGNGLVTRASSADIGQSALINVPHDLVLNAEAVEEYAKEDSNFRAFLDACGHKSPRHDVLLFLLVQLIVSSRPVERIALSNPWTEYVNFLDDHVPVPTLWLEDDRMLLRGTSLESALNAKMLALTSEFDEIREKSSKIEFWNAALWETTIPVRLTDWYLVDAWYRSRVLELPRSGPSLVPCLDMANHSTEASAYYEETPEGDVVLLPLTGKEFDSDEEVTISYGSDKSAAEMLFSYGFLTPSSVARSITLPLSPLPDDPLGKAKIHVFSGMPSIQIKVVGNKIDWSSPFAYLSCLNEEDGLHFKLLQSSDGDTELRMFWQEDDVTAKGESFETLVSEHELHDVFRLRVNMVVFQKIQEQLERLGQVPGAEEAANENINATNAWELRRIEEDVLGRTAAALEDQRTELLDSPIVSAYLATMGAPMEDQDASFHDEAADVEDFS